MTQTLGTPWLAASLALGLHVLDEARHDFLATYNKQASRIRRALGGFPFPPTFTFWPWVSGLTGAVIVLLALTPAAYHGAPWLRPLALLLAIEHCANGLFHLGASAVTRRAVPGVLTAPILLGTGIWLLFGAMSSMQ